MLGKPCISSLFPNSLNSIKHEHSCKFLYFSISVFMIILLTADDLGASDIFILFDHLKARNNSIDYELCIMTAYTIIYLFETHY